MKEIYCNKCGKNITAQHQQSLILYAGQALSEKEKEMCIPCMQKLEKWLDE